MQLTEAVRRRVVDGILEGLHAPGDRLPTERDMAVLTGTSRITVRRAYAQLERAGIITRRPSAGTCVATSFTGNSAEMEQIAILARLSDPFSVDFIGAVNRLCRESDILNILAVPEQGGPDQSALAISLAAKGVKGMIVWGVDRRFDFNAFERLRILGVNMAFFDRVVPGPYADYIGLDNRHAVATLFERALKDGMREMVFVGIAGLEADSNEERRRAAEALCQKNGVKFALSLSPYLDDPAGMAAFAEDFRDSHGKLSKGAAIFCVNDTIALSLLGGERRPGWRLYSIDGTPAAAAMGVVSYSQPMREMAEAAVESLQRQQRQGASWRARQYRFKGAIAT